MDNYIHQLCDQYKITEKDRYDILQIYTLLPVHKKRRLVENFENFAKRLSKMQFDMQLEREILIGEALTDIKGVLDRIKQKREIVTMM